MCKCHQASKTTRQCFNIFTLCQLSKPLYVNYDRKIKAHLQFPGENCSKFNIKPLLLSVIVWKTISRMSGFLFILSWIFFEKNRQKVCKFNKLTIKFSFYIIFIFLLWNFHKLFWHQAKRRPQFTSYILQWNKIHPEFYPGI